MAFYAGHPGYFSAIFWVLDILSQPPQNIAIWSQRHISSYEMNSQRVYERLASRRSSLKRKSAPSSASILACRSSPATMNRIRGMPGMRDVFESSELKDMAIEEKRNLTTSEPRSGAPN